MYENNLKETYETGFFFSFNDFKVVFRYNHLIRIFSVPENLKRSENEHTTRFPNTVAYLTVVLL